jgi:hypothetical protein
MFALLLMMIIGAVLDEESPTEWEKHLDYRNNRRDANDLYWQSTKGPQNLPRNTTTRDRIFETPQDKPSRWKTGRP